MKQNMKWASRLALIGGFLTLLGGRAQTQVIYTLEEHTSDVGNAIKSSPVINANAPSLHTATLSQTTTGSTAAQPGFTYVNNNGGGIVSYGNNLSNVAISNGGDGTALETLTVTFDQAVTMLTFQFVTVPLVVNNPIELNATANTGLTSSSAGTANLITGNNEGSLSLTGSAFTSIVIQLNTKFLFTGDANASIGDVFAVDTFVSFPNASVPAPVPEPGVLTFFLGAALPLAWRLCRR